MTACFRLDGTVEHLYDMLIRFMKNGCYSGCWSTGVMRENAPTFTAEEVVGNSKHRPIVI